MGHILTPSATTHLRRIKGCALSQKVLFSFLPGLFVLDREGRSLLFIITFRAGVSVPPRA